MATPGKTKRGTRPPASGGTKTTPPSSKTTKPAKKSATPSPKPRAKRTGKSKPLKPRKAPTVAPEDRKLRGKQEPFCQWYVSAICNFNATDAARRAGYKGHDKQLAVVGHQNLIKPHIAKRVAELKAVALSDANITIEKVLRDLEVTRVRALEAGKFGPAARCAELHGKYLKMWTDKIEHVADYEDMSVEDLQALLLEVAEAGGVDLSKLIAGNGSGDGVLPDPAEDPTVH